MAKFVLDTGIVLGLIRKSPWAHNAVEAYHVFDNANFVYISSITRVELMGMAYRLGWGAQKIDNLDKLLKRIPEIGINEKLIEDKYIEIDAYRENKHHSKKLPNGTSAFKIGDHDTWIAATASVIEAKLITSDKDFDKIDGVFIERIFVPQEK